MEQVRLPLPRQLLFDLPPGAEYRRQSGRASAALRNEGDTLVVYATCDSLQALVELYERSLRQSQADLRHIQENARLEKRKSSNPTRGLLYALIAGLATGIVLTIKTKRIWQKVY